MRLSRRSLLTTTAAVGAALVGSSAQAKAVRSGTSVDVVVIGGGLSGLIAARAIKQQGRSVLLLEAKPRIGGRMVNQAVPGGGVVAQINHGSSPGCLADHPSTGTVSGFQDVNTQALLPQLACGDQAG